MSKADSPSETELPDGQVALNLRRDQDRRQFAACRREIAEERGVEPDELSNTEVFRAVAQSYLSDEQEQFNRLLDDERIQQAREVVARDHDVQPEDVSLACLLKITAGAYCGFQQTSDWEIGETDETATEEP